jgi:hypothetical protein
MPFSSFGEVKELTALPRTRPDLAMPWLRRRSMVYVPFRHPEAVRRWRRTADADVGQWSGGRAPMDRSRRAAWPSRSSE